MAVDLAPELLEILACPNCHGALAVDHEREELICLSTDCGLAYPVRHGIPVLLIDEARRPADATGPGPSPAGPDTADPDIAGPHIAGLDTADPPASPQEPGPTGP